MKLLSWYEWQINNAADPADTDADLTDRRPPLTTDNPKAYLYCLDGIRRFEGRPRDQIFPIVSEISILGMTGINHENPDKAYSLKSYPDETFTGLHLLCLMYVGFKIIEPAMNSGLDFSEAYALALQAHQAKMQ